LTIPNLITIGRLISVPIIIALMLDSQYAIAFGLFVLSGISDALDGFIAKRFNASTRLGAYLDPVADKVLLISMYVTLAIQDEIGAWLAILVVSRDLLIIGAIILSLLMNQRIKMAPLLISKWNTTFQITLAAAILGTLAFAVSHATQIGVAPYQLTLGEVIFLLTGLVALTTVWSGASYLRYWLDSIGGSEADEA